jgi:ABC-type sulfate transport system permease component
MVAFLGLIILSIGAALLLVWFIVTRELSLRRTLLLTLAAVLVVSVTCIIVGYFGLRVYINGHYEINLVMLRFFVLPPIAAGVLAGLLSAAMFAALKR